jgi:hypothetical protein
MKAAGTAGSGTNTRGKVGSQVVRCLLGATLLVELYASALTKATACT